MKGFSNYDQDFPCGVINIHGQTLNEGTYK